MANLKVALLQFASCGLDQRANFLKGAEYCRRAAELGAAIALFPEMRNIGYQRYDAGEEGARERWIASAIPRQGEFVHHYRRLARWRRPILRADGSSGSIPVDPEELGPALSMAVDSPGSAASGRPRSGPSSKGGS